MTYQKLDIHALWEQIQDEKEKREEESYIDEGDDDYQNPIDTDLDI